MPDPTSTNPPTLRTPPGTTALPDGWLTTQLLALAEGDERLPAVPGYQVIAEIGRGGMGVVYRARDEAFGREVAVKLLQEQFPTGGEAAQRFLCEARITGQLQHPGIPAAYHAGLLPDGRPFLAMKLIRGRTLDALLRASGGRDADHRPLPLRERAAARRAAGEGNEAEDIPSPGPPAADHPLPQGERVEDGAVAPRSPGLITAFEQVCQAVACAHAQRIIHRDLKPQNVMVGAFGEVQVMDWGLAKVLGSASDCAGASAADPLVVTPQSADDRTQAGSLLGTPAYMSPEQAVGAVELLDERTDVFGLGAILCAVLTGRPPYPSDAGECSRRRAARGDLADAVGRLARCGADPGLVALCRRCLSPDQADRPADAGAVAAEVARLRADADDRARRTEVERAAAAAEAREQRKRRRVQAVLGLTFTASVVAAGSMYWWIDHQTAEHRADRSAAVARAQEAVGAAAVLAADLRDQFRYAEALRALNDAAGLIPPDAPPDIREAVERERADTQLARDLDEVRFGRVRSDAWTGLKGLGEAYRRAFTAAGFDPSGPDPAAVDRVAGSPVRRVLAAALTDWAELSAGSAEVRERLLAAARRADPGVWGDQLRDPALRDGPARERHAARLARVAPIADLPPTHLVLLLQRLQAPWPGSRAALAAAAARHRADFWVQYEIGNFYISKDRDLGQAVGPLRAALAVRPDCTGALDLLAEVLVDTGDPTAAVACRRVAVAVDPGDALAQNGLAWLLAAGPDVVRDGRAAIPHATKACELTRWAKGEYLDTLAAAHAAAGDFPTAVEVLNRALSLPEFAKKSGGPARQRLDRYARRTAYQDERLIYRELAPPPREAKP